ncbi:MAG: GGDEF domain-containing protein [Lachnospiraceae bacterium]|nr:GGDEF domain-containing protein [Lachnospiraceae bacterium]
MFAYYTVIVAFTVIYQLALGVQITKNSVIDNQKKTAFLICLITLLLAILAEWFGVYLDGKPSSLRGFHIAVKVVEFTLAPTCVLLCGVAISATEMLNQLLAITAVNFILEVLSGVLGFIFYVDEHNVYHRSSFYWIYICMFGFAAVFLFYKVYQLSRSFQGRHIASLICLICFLIFGVGVQMIDSEIRLCWLCTTMALGLLISHYTDMLLQTDELTGLLNQRLFQNSLQDISVQTVIIRFDIDDFRRVNARYGYHYGDLCLKTIGNMILMIFGSCGYCYRNGGDEFTVVMNKHQSQLQTYLSKFEHAMDDLRMTDPNLPHLSYATVTLHQGNDVQQLIASADMLIDERKRKRNLGLLDENDRMI